MEIYFIRHTSVDVPKGVVYGQTDVPLKDSFEQEAEVVLSKIKEVDFDAAYVSPLSRCVRLATYCGFQDAIRDQRIMEINMGEWEMKSFDTSIDFQEAQRQFDILNNKAPGGESFGMLYNRVSEFINEIKQQDYNKVAVFAHGGVLASAQVYSGQIKTTHLVDELIPYGGIVQIEV